MDTGTAALVGAVIGASAAIGSGMALEAFKRRRDRRATAHALAASIEAFKTIADFMGYEAEIKGAYADVCNGKLQFHLTLWDDDKLNPVAAVYLDKIGLLGGRQAAEVVLLISYLATIRAETVKLNKGDYADSSDKTFKVMNNLVALWGLVDSITKTIVVELRMSVADEWLSLSKWPRHAA